MAGSRVFKKPTYLNVYRSSTYTVSRSHKLPVSKVSVSIVMMRTMLPEICSIGIIFLCCTCFSQRAGKQLLKEFALRCSQHQNNICRKSVPVLFQKSIYVVHHLSSRMQEMPTKTLNIREPTNFLIAMHYILCQSEQKEVITTNIYEILL